MLNSEDQESLPIAASDASGQPVRANYLFQPAFALPCVYQT